MAKLIVALDGNKPFDLAIKLAYQDPDLAQRWFKVGPQTAIRSWDWDQILFRAPNWRIFLDLKIYDTTDTVREVVKRAAGAGVASVSVCALYAAGVDAAMEAARGSDLRVWEILWLSDDAESPRTCDYWRNQASLNRAHGIICPAQFVRAVREGFAGDVIGVGCRFSEEVKHGHTKPASPFDVSVDASYAVVGRPIWEARDPIATTKLYRNALGK